MIILGIDPGTDRAGYGLVESKGQSLRYIEAGLLKTEGAQGADALFKIKIELDGLLARHRPDLLATERLFFVKNRTTGMATAEARGVILLAAREKNIPVRELSPTEVKTGIAGFGRADKIAVLKMVRLILKTPGLRVIDDAADALAMAIVAARSPIR